MPNAAGRRTRKMAAQAAPTTNETENGVKVTSTLNIGELAIEELGDYEFTRQGAGRKREPSQFDDYVNDWVGTTRRIPVEDTDQGNDVIKQLAKACDYRNRGLEKRIETMDGQLYVVFKVNEEKAKRERKPRDVESVADVDRVDAAETE